MIVLQPIKYFATSAKESTNTAAAFHKATELAAKSNFFNIVSASEVGTPVRSVTEENFEPERPSITFDMDELMTYGDVGGGIDSSASAADASFQGRYTPELSGSFSPTVSARAHMETLQRLSEMYPEYLGKFTTDEELYSETEIALRASVARRMSNASDISVSTNASEIGHTAAVQSLTASALQDSAALLDTSRPLTPPALSVEGAMTSFARRRSVHRSQNDEILLSSPARRASGESWAGMAEDKLMAKIVILGARA
jgi:hypothetical protein